MALGKPVGSGLTRFSVVSNKAATGPRQRSESALYLLAGALMSSPAIAVRATEPVSSVARIMLELGVGGVPVLDAGGRPVGMVSDGDLLGRRGERASLTMARDAMHPISLWRLSQKRS